MEQLTYEEKLKIHATQFLIDKANPKEPPKEVVYLDEAVDFVKSELGKINPKDRADSINLFNRDTKLHDLNIYHMIHDHSEYDRIRRHKGGISHGVLLYKFDRMEFNEKLREIFGEDKP